MFNFKFPAINLWTFPSRNKEKISFRVDPLSANIRFFRGKINPNKNISEESSEWYKIITIQATDSGEIYFSGVKEGLTKTEYSLLFKYFKSKGYKEGYYRHKGKEFYVDFRKKKFNLTKL